MALNTTELGFYLGAPSPMQVTTISITIPLAFIFVFLGFFYWVLKTRKSQSDLKYSIASLGVFALFRILYVQARAYIGYLATLASEMKSSSYVSLTISAINGLTFWDWANVIGMVMFIAHLGLILFLVVKGARDNKGRGSLEGTGIEMKGKGVLVR